MPIWFRPRRPRRARMADAANAVSSIAATGVAGGSDLGPADVLLALLSQGTALLAVRAEQSTRIADLESTLHRLGAVQKCTQAELDLAHRRHQRDQATIRRLELRLEAQKQKLKSEYVRT